MTIKKYSHTRLVLSQPVMSVAPALLLFEHHHAWAVVLWRCSGCAPVPASGGKLVSIACNAKKEKQSSLGPAHSDPETHQPLNGLVIHKNSTEWYMHTSSH